MARPREFDPNEVLEHAMRVFWTQGFGLSSLDDICKASGINRTSLYATFGDKRELLRRSIALYVEDGTARLAKVLAPPRPIRDAIAAFLGGLIDDIVAGPGRTGCFLGNCAAELAQHDRAAMTSVRQGLQRLEAVLLDSLAAANARGELVADADVIALSRFFMSGFQGLLLVGKANPNRKTLEDIATTMVRVLD